ncbi:MAG: hypothetical protein HY033_12790 [Ignavibacteriae bacterium]|nr:hypothetical protein [Ignavibacteria bacterium]MBI3365770.1 hypothetical protein [Ignavibacteriota bacterium]
MKKHSSLLAVCSQILLGSLFCTTIWAQSVAKGPRPGEQTIPVVLSVRGAGSVEFDVIARNEKYYLPLVTIFKFLRVSAEYDARTGVVEGFFLSPDNRYRIDAGSNTFRIRDTSGAISTDDYVVQPQDFYLREDLYQQFFGIELKYRPVRLDVLLRTKLLLPVFLERKREMARNEQLLLQGYQPEVGYSLPHTHPLLAGGRLDYRFVTSSSSRIAPQYRYFLDLGNRFLGGDLKTNLQGVINRPIKSEDFLISWQYAFLDQSFIRQINLGDMFSTGLRAQRIFGGEITNRPAPRRLLFAEDEFSDFIGVNHTVDFYKGASVIQSESSDPAGLYRFQSVLPYGISNYSVKEYDQYGAEHVSEYRIIVPVSMLPPGEVEYSLMGGTIRPGRHDWNSTFNMSWGVSNRLTMGGGIDYLGQSGIHTRFFPSLTSTARVTDIAVLDATIAPSAYSTVVFSVFYPSTLGGSISYTRYGTNSFYNSLNALDDAILTFNVPIRLPSQPLLFSFILRQTSLTDRRIRGLQATSSFGTGLFGVRLNEIFSWDQDAFSSSRLTQHNSRVTLTTVLPRGIFLRGTMTYDHLLNNVPDLRITASLPLKQNALVSAFVDRDYISHISTYGLQLTYYFPFSVFRGSVTREGGDGTYGFTGSIAGSVAFVGERGRFVFDNLNQVGFGSVFVNPFVDLNGNGAQDAGEEQIAKARFGSRVGIEGGSQVKYESPLGYRMKRTLPYEWYTVTLDSLSLEDPKWVPRFQTFAVFSEPDQVRVVDLPIVVGGIVRGTVQEQTSTGLKPVDGMNVRIESEEIEKGFPKYKKAMRTFSTGEFEFLGVPPGRYTVTVNEDQAATLGRVVEKPRLSIEVAVKPEGDEVNGVNFLLK